jgi:hypothetical protein
MLISVNGAATVDYSLKGDTSEPKTVFQLGLYDSFIASRLQHLMLSKSKETEANGTADLTDVIFEFIRHGLKGVKNFDVPFETTTVDVPKVGKRVVVSDDFLKKLNIAWVIELYSELMSLNFLNEEASKN